MLRIDLLHSNVVAAEIFVCRSNNVGFSELLHALDLGAVVFPLRALDKGLTHHCDARGVELEARFLILFEVVNDGGDYPFVELASFN